MHYDWRQYRPRSRTIQYGTKVEGGSASPSFGPQLGLGDFQDSQLHCMSCSDLSIYSNLLIPGLLSVLVLLSFFSTSLFLMNQDEEAYLGIVETEVHSIPLVIFLAQFWCLDWGSQEENRSHALGLMSPSRVGLPRTPFQLSKVSQELSPISWHLPYFSNFLSLGWAMEEDIPPSFAVFAVSENMHIGLSHGKTILRKKETDRITKATNKREF